MIEVNQSNSRFAVGTLSSGNPGAVRNQLPVVRAGQDWPSGDLAEIQS